MTITIRKMRMAAISVAAWGLLGNMAQAGPLHVANGQFVDTAGNVVVLRGTALSQHTKIPPFEPVTDPSIFPRLKSLGYNLVRDQFNWEAYEPSPGVYNAGYLDYYQSTVNRAAAAGLYVIVDFHQDMWSRNAFGGCGEGMPLWSLPPYITPQTPRDDSSCSGWELTALLNAGNLDRIFTDFFRDTYGVRTRYLAMLDTVVDRLAGSRNIIGYEPINEPWGFAADLQNFHTLAMAEIRKADPTAIAFLEPVVDFNPLDGGGIQSAAAKSPLLGPVPAFGNVAFSPHYYNPYVIETTLWLGDSSAGRLAAMKSVAQKWNAALWLGEFGAPNSGNLLGYLDDIYTQLDANGYSASTWAWTPEWNTSTDDGWNMENYSLVKGDGVTLQANNRIRPHVYQVGGSYGSLTVSYAGFLSWPGLTFSWTASTSQGTTELFVPYSSLFGNRSPYLLTTGNASCQENIAQQLLSCTATGNGAPSVKLF